MLKAPTRWQGQREHDQKGDAVDTPLTYLDISGVKGTTLMYQGF